MRSEKKPAGQMKSFIEQARRRQIIEATIAELADSGYTGASLAKVADRAEISKGVVLYHFASKAELLEETVKQIYAELWDFIRPQFEAESCASARLRAYIQSEFAFFENHHASLLALGTILDNHRDSQGRLFLREQSERVYLETLGAILERGKRSGEFRAFVVKPMAVIVMHAVNGALRQWAKDQSVGLSGYAQELLTTFELATRKQAP
jgi:AcrR family transcriptional regulator